MSASELLQWYYMIFLLPFGVAAFMLLISSLKLGHRHGAHGGSAHANHGVRGGMSGGQSHGHGASPAAGGHRGHTPASTNHAATAVRAAHAGKGGHTKAHGAKPARNSTAPAHLLANLLGIGRAPTTIVVQAFALAWGFSGYWANQMLLHTANPTPEKLWPSLLVALAGGLIGARLVAEIMARLLPQDESLVVSRDSLFGLTGNVAFPVSETGGRIVIYDAYGSLHDESCRTAPGHPPIEKGRKALVVDRDAQGRLIVEETA